MSEIAYWFVSTCACIMVMIGVWMFGILTTVTLLSGSILALIGIVIITHMGKQETYKLWIGR